MRKHQEPLTLVGTEVPLPRSTRAAGPRRPSPARNQTNQTDHTCRHRAPLNNHMTL